MSRAATRPALGRCSIVVCAEHGGWTSHECHRSTDLSVERRSSNHSNSLSLSCSLSHFIEALERSLSSRLVCDLKRPCQRHCQHRCGMMAIVHDLPLPCTGRPWWIACNVVRRECIRYRLVRGVFGQQMPGWRWFWLWLPSDVKKRLGQPLVWVRRCRAHNSGVWEPGSLEAHQAQEWKSHIAAATVALAGSFLMSQNTGPAHFCRLAAHAVFFSVIFVLSVLCLCSFGACFVPLSSFN